MTTNKWFIASPGNMLRSLDIVRITVALVLLVHGAHGVFNPDAMNGFGEFLDSLGFPFGVGVAWAVVVLQVLCSAALLLRRLVVPACLGHLLVLGTGVWTDHARHGWFVVGPGENGVEYSLTLIACLVAVLLAYWPRKQG